MDSNERPSMAPMDEQTSNGPGVGPETSPPGLSFDTNRQALFADRLWQPQGRARVAERRRVGPRSLAVAVAASLVIHAVLLVVFVQSLGSWPPFSERPITTVELVPQLPAHTSGLRREHQAPRGSANPVSGGAHFSASRPLARPGPSEPDSGESPNGGARQALRYLVGCEHAAFFGLTSEERQHCEDQMIAARKASAPLQFDVLARGQYIDDPEPYLNRRPTNGCKVRAAGVKAPRGPEGAATGLTCARPF